MTGTKFNSEFSTDFFLPLGSQLTQLVMIFCNMDKKESLDPINLLYPIVKITLKILNALLLGNLQLITVYLGFLFPNKISNAVT